MSKILSLISLCILALAPQTQGALLSGQPAPDFTLPSADGASVKLSSAKGHFVVLEWFNHNCPFVHKFYDSGAMQKWQEEMTAKGVLWYAIDSTNPKHEDYLTPEAARKSYKDMHLAATALLLDEKGVVGKLYGATNTPQVFLISPEGVLLYQGAIDDRRSSAAYDADNSHNYLLEAIHEAMSGGTVAEPATKPYGCSVKYGE
jgi:peroxiredoxin